MSQKSGIGNWIVMIGVSGNINQEPDAVFARISGSEAEKLEDLVRLKDGLIEETGKNYEKIYAFSFKGDDRKLSIDLTLDIAIPIEDEVSAALWSHFSTRFDFLQEW